MGADPQAIVRRLEAQITPGQRQAWASGESKAWALDSYGVAIAVAYTLNTPPGCASDTPPLELPADYEVKAQAAAELQLKKAAVRLAWVLNRALG